MLESPTGQSSGWSAPRAAWTFPLPVERSNGLAVTPELVASISPYIRERIRRFGRYVLDMDDLPSPLEPALLPFEEAS